MADSPSSGALGTLDGLEHRDVAERGGAAVAVGRSAGRDPHRVPGDLGRIGKEQEDPRRERRVQHVVARAAEDLLADDDAEGDADRDLPEGNRRRQHEREEHAGDQEALVHVVPPDDREQALPEASHRERHDQDRQVVERAVGRVGEQAGSVERQTQHLHRVGAPVRQGRRAAGDRYVNLPAGVPHRHQDAGHERHDDRHHQALEVERVAHVRGAGRRLARRVQERVGRLVQRVEALEAAPGLEMTGLPVENAAQESHLSGASLPSRSVPARHAGTARTPSCPGRRRCRAPGPPPAAPGSRVPRRVRCRRPPGT